MKDGQTLGRHRYRLNRSDDFRKGSIHFFFDAPNYIELYFGTKFSTLMIGRVHDVLFTETLDWYIVTGIKSPADFLVRT